MVPFVYLYHLVLFFFIGGYFYSEEKYGDKPYDLFVSRLKNNWKKYFFFCVFFVLIHNLLYSLGMIINTTNYTFPEILAGCIDSTFFMCNENMAGALWFVPVYIFASVLFTVIIFYSRKIKNSIKSTRISKELIQNILIIVLTLLIGILGYLMNTKQLYLTFHAQTSFLVIPVFTVGYFLRKYIKDISKILKLPLFILAFTILYLCVYKWNYSVELSVNEIGQIYKFFPVSLIGIYFCLYISKIISKISYVKDCFNTMGTYSFEIMASHFLVFKIIDYIYSIIRGINDSNIYGRFPTAFRELEILYVLLGIMIPMIVFYLKDKLIGKRNKK